MDGLITGLTRGQNCVLHCASSSFWTLLQLLTFFLVTFDRLDYMLHKCTYPLISPGISSTIILSVLPSKGSFSTVFIKSAIILCSNINIYILHLHNPYPEWFTVHCSHLSILSKSVFSTKYVISSLEMQTFTFITLYSTIMNTHVLNKLQILACCILVHSKTLRADTVHIQMSTLRHLECYSHLVCSVIKGEGVVFTNSDMENNVRN